MYRLRLKQAISELRLENYPVIVLIGDGIDEQRVAVDRTGAVVRTGFFQDAVIDNWHWGTIRHES